MNATKIQVGLSMLADARLGEFDASASILNKLLGNVVANPAEPKYRQIRLSNPKINQALSVRGAKALLVGAGFVEAGDVMKMDEAAPVDGAQAAIAGLAAQAEERAAAEEAAKAERLAAVKEKENDDNEERKRMRDTIADDADMRKQPGWTAKAAGVKGGKAITGCSDVGIGQNSGG